MIETNEILKKLQVKDTTQPALVMNAPESYNDVISLFETDVHTKPILDKYYLIQVFGTTNAEISSLSKEAIKFASDDGLVWLCYPKKSSKKYKGSDCSRETLAGMLADEGYEPVRQIAIDDDWSALRYRKPENIKTMKRSFAVTEKGKEKANTK